MANRLGSSKHKKRGGRRMIDTYHPELVEFEGETLGDTLTNLITEVKRLRDLHILACDYLQDISDGTLPDSEWPHIHAMITGEEE